MRDFGPLGEVDGTPFVDANPTTGEQGSPVPAHAFNITKKELFNLITGAGLVPSADDSDLTQVLQAVQSIAALIGSGNQVTQVLAGASLAHVLALGEQGVIWIHLPPSSGDPRTIDLPDALGGRFYAFIRTDGEPATVTVRRAAGDTIDDVGANFTLVQNQVRSLIALDDTRWVTRFRFIPPASATDVLAGIEAEKPAPPVAIKALWGKGTTVDVPVGGVINPGNTAGFFDLTNAGANTLTAFNAATTGGLGREITFRVLADVPMTESAGLVTGQGDLVLPAGAIAAFRLVAAGVWMMTQFRPPAVFAGQPWVGKIEWSSTPTAAPGWIPADGGLESRTVYAALFAKYQAIGLPYGVGDGSTTFGKPDYRGRAIFGMDDLGTAAGAAGRLTGAGGLDPASVGNAGGSETVTQTIDTMVSHTHTYRDATGGGASLGNGGIGYPTVPTGSRGGSQPMPNMPPAALAYPFIYTGVVAP